jgi:uncharacterized protein (DUF1499 family)
VPNSRHDPTLEAGFGRIDAMWTFFFGPSDLGAVDFGSLQRRKSPNDALACPLDLCSQAAPDVIPPVFSVSAERLAAILTAVARGEPRTQLVFAASQGLRWRYVVRSPVLRFPDTVDALVLARGESRSTLALYSRSQIGFRDFGVNRRRIRRWLKAVERAAA